MKKFFYRVEAEDLLSVSKKFGVPPTVLIKDNGLKKEISRGDVLFINVPDEKHYAVRPADTLKSVAEKFGITEAEISEKNGVDYIFYGLTLWI